LTPAASWAESNLSAETLDFEPEEDLEGPLTLAVAAERSLADEEEADAGLERDAEEEGIDAGDADEADADENDEASETAPEARLVVFGNATFASNGWFEQQLNGDVFLNSVKWLANEAEDLLSIRPKALTDRRLNLMPWQAGLLTWLAIVIFPIGGFTAAGWLWWRGR
ncbi:MAG: ABC transporter, partial [Spirulinaceae cyanobacterium]